TASKRRNLLARYARWLHTMWPAGTVEKLPQVNPDGTSNVPGLRVVGDLTGIPLLKFSSDTGARAARAIAAELKDGSGVPPESDKSVRPTDGVLDLVIIGAGVAGMAAALEA